MPHEIIAFFERYRDAFNALDGKAVAELYADKSGIAQDAAYTHWPSRQPVTDNMAALCKIYRDNGFVRADFEPGQFIDQGKKPCCGRRTVAHRLEFRPRAVVLQDHVQPHSHRAGLAGIALHRLLRGSAS